MNLKAKEEEKRVALATAGEYGAERIFSGTYLRFFDVIEQSIKRRERVNTIIQ